MPSSHEEVCRYCGEPECHTTCTTALVQHDDVGTNEDWLCAVGHLHRDGLHCSDTGQEPPWGCPCSKCQDPTEEEEWDGLPPYGDDAL